jgi:hydroxymethylpyrimidine kinase/phosphomethylpyrimidine kinase/thiamine-phosphate diphosphorylase
MKALPPFQLRLKDASSEQIDWHIQQAQAAIADKAVHFFVNDHWQAAIAFNAYGVHLGQEDLHDANLDAISAAGLRLGVSTHSYWELARALAVNPSYIALGPIYETTSKQMPFAPQGQARLAEWVRILKGRYAVVAIGGINQQRAQELKATQVGSVAMITAITQAEDYQHATRELLRVWQ